MMIARSLHEDNSTGKFFIMNLSKDDMLLLRKGLESLANNPMEFNPKRIKSMIRSFNDPNFVVDNENIYPLYAKKENVYGGHEFVDLGLPSGLLWATCNVGATSPEQAGLYFAWGETVGYTAAQVKRGKRIFINKSYEAKKIKEDLALEQDAAHVCMGGKWRIPTIEEFEELIDNCDVSWTTNYNGTGVNGRIFTGPNGKSVFFPAAGHCHGSSVCVVGLCGDYWSASCNSVRRTQALDFCSWDVSVSSNYRYCGQSVRAVCER